MTKEAKHRPLVGQPGYGGVCEGCVGEQGPPENAGETSKAPPTSPAGLDYRRGPPDEDDEDDRQDDAPKLVLPQIGVPVDVTE